MLLKSVLLSLLAIAAPFAAASSPAAEDFNSDLHVEFKGFASRGVGAAYLNSTLEARQQRTFTNPVNQQRGADPCMRFINGRYFLTSTQNTEIAMWSATTIAGLKTAPKKTLYTDTTAGRDWNLWAPEFWYLNGTWYIYYAVAGNRNDNLHRQHVLRGGTDPNDPSTGPYTYAARLVPPNFDQWAVDGSILQLNGRLYLLFSGAPTTNPWRQNTYISLMSSPTQLSGNAVMISGPTFNWEMVGAPVHEGQEVIQVGGVTRIIYSASHCSSEDYALGMLTLNNGADPMLPSSWVKSPNPIFGKNVTAGVYS